MKKIFLSLFTFTTVACFATNTNEKIDKVRLQEIKNQVLVMLKQQARMFDDIFAETSIAELTCMIEQFEKADEVQLVLTDASNEVFSLIVNEKKSFEEAVLETGAKCHDDLYEKLMELLDKYPEDDDNTLWSSFLEIAYHARILGNLLEKIDAALQ